jgi:MOSC domain-containing protein YiiM
MGTVIGIARRESKRAVMETLESAIISDETGVADDFRGTSNLRQVTLLSSMVWNKVCQEVNSDLPWTTRRANLLIDGLEFPQQKGELLKIGEVLLQITMEMKPCYRMDEQFTGLKEALKPEWRGGICCKVLHGGSVTIGDQIYITSK